MVKKCFAIFKTGRTGSTSLSGGLNNCGLVYCKNEILNNFSGNPDKDIDEFINSFLFRESGMKIAGFTLNPFNKPNFDGNSWFFPKDTENIVFSLTREVWQQSISLTLSRMTSSFPKDRTSPKAKEILDMMENKVFLDEQKFRKIYVRLSSYSQRITQFAKDFARINKATYVPLTYENLYHNNNIDLLKIDKCLGIKLSLSDFDNANKVIPTDLSSWLVNIKNLKTIKEEVDEVNSNAS